MSISRLEDRYIRNADSEKREDEHKKLGKEFEPVFCSFLDFVGKKSGLISEVRRGTTADDHAKTDLVITLANGKKLAAQLTFATDKAIRMEKLQEILRLPVTSRLYDERGIPIRTDPMPRILLTGGDSYEKWQQALEHSKNNDLPENFFKDAEAMGDYIMQQFVLNLKYLAGIDRADRELFMDYIEFFESAKKKAPPKSKTEYAND
jgi:hypothetical protein